MSKQKPATNSDEGDGRATSNSKDGQPVCEPSDEPDLPPPKPGKPVDMSRGEKTYDNSIVARKLRRLKRKFERKSDTTLRQRVKKLTQQGVEVGLEDGLTVAELVAEFPDVVGDLGLYEVKRLVDLALVDLAAKHYSNRIFSSRM